MVEGPMYVMLGPGPSNVPFPLPALFTKRSTTVQIQSPEYTAQSSISSASVSDCDQSEMEETEKEPIRAASEEVSREFKTLINAEDLDSLKQSQNLILGRLQDSNAVLSHFNDYSEHCFAEVSGDFSRNTRLLRSMKSDLDYIFQKLRSMKSRILATYPDAFPDGSTEVLDRRPDLEMPQ